MNTLQKIYNALIVALIFVIPINLFIAFPLGSEYLNGQRIDYLIPKLYVSELLALGVLIVGISILIQARGGSFKLVNAGWKIALSILTLLLALSQLLSPLPLIGLISFSKVVLTLCLMSVLVATYRVVIRTVIFFALATSIFWQSFLSLYQWLTQQSFLPYFLSGEPTFEWSIFIAKSSLLNQGNLLPYGSSPHPNILGGIMAVYGLGVVLFLIQSIKQRDHSHHLSAVALIGLVSVLLSLMTVILTESISALLTLFVGSSFIAYDWHLSHTNHSPTFHLTRLSRIHWYLIALITCLIVSMIIVLVSPKIPGEHSITRRSVLLQAGSSAFMSQPIHGVGSAQFVVWLNESQFLSAIAPFIQPVHAVPILFLAEVGVIGLIWILLFAKVMPVGWFSFRLPVLWLAILPILLFDHYLMTLTSGLLLMAVIPTIWDVSNKESRVAS